MQRIERWAVPVLPPASVLEISCADGFMTEALVRRGFRVTGIDLSPEMVKVAKERLSSAGLEADLRVADANTFEPDRTWDVLLAPMATFYHYIDDPAALVARLAPSITQKVLVDLNPREVDPDARGPGPSGGGVHRANRMGAGLRAEFGQDRGDRQMGAADGGIDPRPSAAPS